MRLTNGETLLRWPLAQHILTQGWHGGAHNGIDLRCTWGGTTAQPVYAAEDGTVDWVQAWDGHTKTGNQSYGNCVRVVHTPWRGGQLKTLYAHLSQTLVQPGQTVQEGQLIGYTGNTGNSYGAHLHFEVIWGGKRTNPLVWLDGDFTTASAAVYTYGPGEHAVAVPDEASEPPAAPAARLQKLCVVNASAALIEKVKALGLPVESAACALIGPASNGDAMAIWQDAQADDSPYFASYTED